MTAEGGLDGYYKPDHWLPVAVTLTNQGTATRVEVRARFTAGLDSGGSTYRLPERPLQASANERHYLYMKPPTSFATQPLTLDFINNGRASTQQRPKLSLVAEGDWLVVGIGAGESTSPLKLLTTTTLAQVAPQGRPWMRGGQTSTRINVAALEPQMVPDRWQGLESADMLVLANVSDRDLTPEQQTAVRDYVTAGGTLVVTGGVNWNRLTTPFYRDLLPVQVTGARSASNLPALDNVFGSRAPATSAFTLCTSTLKPGATLLSADGDQPGARRTHSGMPLIAAAQRGSGRVVYIAFDPALPPFQAWNGVTQLWKSLLQSNRSSQVIPQITATERMDTDSTGGYPGYGQTIVGARLADAPFAISQLDIPAFWIVAVFLLAYIIVLVPVNYYFLKARDKKEYAWLTTPLIVLVFSFGAYMIGYGFKGGSTLLAKVALVEAHAAQDSAPSITYAGIFSPRKTSYDIQLAGDNPTAQAEAAAALISEPSTTRNAAGLQVGQGDVQRVEHMPVDMWAMRVLKSEGMVRLGRGITCKWTRQSGGFAGTVQNDSPYNLEDCSVVWGNTVVALPAIARGQSVPFQSASGAGSTSASILPAALMGDVKGSRNLQRMKRAVLQPVCSGVGAQPNGWRPPDYPMLAAWIREPVSRFQVDGDAAREQAATLLLVHLDQRP